MPDQRGQLLRAAVGFAACSMPSYDRALWALRDVARAARGVGRTGRRRDPVIGSRTEVAAMDLPSWICPLCARVIGPEETFVLRSDRLARLDCKRPMTSSPEERALLFRYCWTRTVAECGRCSKAYRVPELASDVFSGRGNLCPSCKTDLTVNVREHFYNCTMLPTAVRQRAREAREMTRRLRKLSRELRDQKDALMRELEVGAPRSPRGRRTRATSVQQLARACPNAQRRSASRYNLRYPRCHRPIRRAPHASSQCSFKSVIA